MSWTIYPIIVYFIIILKHSILNQRSIFYSTFHIYLQGMMLNIDMAWYVYKYFYRLSIHVSFGRFVISCWVWKKELQSVL